MIKNPHKSIEMTQAHFLPSIHSVANVCLQKHHNCLNSRVYIVTIPMNVFITQHFIELLSGSGFNGQF